MKKILVPCDFSAPAIEAFKFAVDIASRTNGEVHVLKVIDFPMITYGASIDMPVYNYRPDLFKELEEDAKKNFEKLQKKFGKGASKILFSAVQGPTFTMIRDFIKKNKIDLVVMGTQGATGMTEFFIGSNTEKVVRFSNAPVLAVRKAIPIDKIKTILFPTSLHLNQTAFIKKLKALQEFFGARLHVLYVNTPFNFVRDGELNDYAKHYHLTNYTLAIRHDRHEQDGILSFAREIKADMIAMATHGRKGLSHLFYGSIAEDVVNHVKCPIWTCAIKV